MTHSWAVIGAGPAGIAAVGQLLDHGVRAVDIAWIDPTFSVGDFGKLWRNVPSNTRVELFLKFLHVCEAFEYEACIENFALRYLPPDQTCPLHVMAEPLAWVTDRLKKKVSIHQALALQMSRKDDCWEINLNTSENITVKSVILALGADPKLLSYNKDYISLPDALDIDKLTIRTHTSETIGVFGSSHSAVLVLKNLLENTNHQVINFYRSPLQYAVYLEDMILFDDTGLKGIAAKFARENLAGQKKSRLTRVLSNSSNLDQYLPLCDKVIYAVGFKSRSIQINDLEGLAYTPQTGIIAPGLFGIGIAFPEARVNRLGILEYKVGLWKFMDYLKRIIPIWLKYP